MIFCRYITNILSVHLLQFYSAPPTFKCLATLLVDIHQVSIVEIVVCESVTPQITVGLGLGLSLALGLRLGLSLGLGLSLRLE